MIVAVVAGGPSGRPASRGRGWSVIGVHVSYNSVPTTIQPNPRGSGTRAGIKFQTFRLTRRGVIRRSLRGRPDHKLFTLMINRPTDGIHKDQTEPIPRGQIPALKQTEVDPEFSTPLSFTGTRGETFQGDSLREREEAV